LHCLQVLNEDNLLQTIEEADSDTLAVGVVDETEEGLVLGVGEVLRLRGEMRLEGQMLKVSRDKRQT
jgi:hypothetical protein